MTFTTSRFVLLLVVITFLSFTQAFAEPRPVRSYPLEVIPPEHQREIDPTTGAELLFLTSDPAVDTNLYYHELSWLSDSSMILFHSDRVGSGLMGYLVKTGELVHIGDGETKLRGDTAALHRNSVFAVADDHIVEIHFTIDYTKDLKGRASRVIAHERILFQDSTLLKRTQLNENANGTLLSYYNKEKEVDSDEPRPIFLVDIESGAARELVSLPAEPGRFGHVQWSRTNPHLLSLSSGAGNRPVRSGPQIESSGQTDYATRRQRLWVIDIREGVPRNIYQAVEGEIVTHAVWWLNDTILFTGAVDFDGKVLSHVKLIDVHRGDVRVAGAGFWWPDADPAELGRLNWWHPAGSDDGNWIVADNWHGDLALFEGRTTRPHILTKGHRTYGKGEHPHPGWDRKGDQVVFTSHKLGSPDVCIAKVPDSFQERVAPNTDGIGDRAVHHKIMPQGPRLVTDDFTNLDNWHLEGHTEGVSLLDGGLLRLDCSGSQQGGVGVHAFYKHDLPDNICLEYDLYTENSNGLMLTFLGMRGLNGEDAISGAPKRTGLFKDYTDINAPVLSYHISLSRYNDEGVHSGVSNWRRNPGIILVGQGPDPCEETGKNYHIALVKQGPLCQLQVDGKVVSGFVDKDTPGHQVPTLGKVGFRAIGAHATFRISNFKVTALE
ncbi:MAG: DUF1961 family protein [Pirellulales bacterium]